jgi:hypothetical protein
MLAVCGATPLESRDSLFRSPVPSSHLTEAGPACAHLGSPRPCIGEPYLNGDCHSGEVRAFASRRLGPPALPRVPTTVVGAVHEQRGILDADRRRAVGDDLLDELCASAERDPSGGQHSGLAAGRAVRSARRSSRPPAGDSRLAVADATCGDRPSGARYRRRNHAGPPPGAAVRDRHRRGRERTHLANATARASPAGRSAPRRSP